MLAPRCKVYLVSRQELEAPDRNMNQLRYGCKCLPTQVGNPVIMIEQNSGFIFRDDVNALQQIREAFGMGRKEFAALMGVDYDTVWSWETGRREPTLKMHQVKILLQHAKRLNIDLSDIPDNLIN